MTDKGLFDDQIRSGGQRDLEEQIQEIENYLGLLKYRAANHSQNERAHFSQIVSKLHEVFAVLCTSSDTTNSRRCLFSDFKIDDDKTQGWMGESIFDHIANINSVIDQGNDAFMGGTIRGR